MIQKFNKGFTLIEILVVVAIIAFIAALALIYMADARIKSRDAKRVSEVKQMMTALEQYYSECGSYPAGTSLILGSASYDKLYSGGLACAGGGFGTTASGITFIQIIKAAPLPVDGTTCNATPSLNSYTYTQISPSAFSVTFCLGKGVQGLGAGPHTGSHSGLR